MEYLDSLMKIDWNNELAPLLDFLNLDHVPDPMRHRISMSYAPKGGTCSAADIAKLHDHMRFLLEWLSDPHMGLPADRERLEKFLSSSLRYLHSEVKVPDPEVRSVRVYATADGILPNIWADFICTFLARDDWREVLGKCPQCQIWFQRSRKDQVYDSDVCKGKAAYARQGPERRSARRQRYWRDKLI